MIFKATYPQFYDRQLQRHWFKCEILFFYCTLTLIELRKIRQHLMKTDLWHSCCQHFFRVQSKHYELFSWSLQILTQVDFIVLAQAQGSRRIIACKLHIYGCITNGLCLFILPYGKNVVDHFTAPYIHTRSADSVHWIKPLRVKVKHLHLHSPYTFI